MYHPNARGKAMSDLMIRTMDDVTSAAKVLQASGYFKDVRDVAQAAVKIMAGNELGIPPIAAMRGFDMVQGQLSMRSHLMAAMIKKSGRYDYKVLDSTGESCSIEFFDKGESCGISTFDKADASAAGLTGREPWKKFPKAMYYNRAMSQGAKMFCPNLFLGAVYDEGEIDGDINSRRQEPKEVEPRRSGLVAAWNAESQEMDIYQPVDDAVPVDEDEGDDIPEPESPSMSKEQRGKLLGQLKALGVLDGDKRALLQFINPSKATASRIIDMIEQAPEGTFPWGVLAHYVTYLRQNAEFDNEDILAYCNSQFNERHPASLNADQRRQLFNWLSMVAEEKQSASESEGDTEDESDIPIVDVADMDYNEQMALWLQECHISNETFESMSEAEIETSVKAWVKRVTEA